MNADRGTSRGGRALIAAAMLVSACRFDETAVGGGVLTGQVYAARTRGLLTGERVALRVVLREADDPADSLPPVPIAGHRVSIELESLDASLTATLPATSGSTGEDGGVTFFVDTLAAGSGTVIVSVFAEPAGLDRVPLAPLELEFVATRPEMLVLERHDLQAGEQGVAVASGDLDGDGHDDLVLLDAAGTVYAWETGCLESVYTAALGHAAVGLTAGEVTGDANDDVLVITRNEPYSLELLRSIGTDSTVLAFDPVAPLAASIGAAPVAIAAAQLDGAGLPELVLLENSDTARVILLSAPVAPAVTPSVDATVPVDAPAASCVAAGRLDADELDDLVIGLRELRQLQVLPGGTGRTPVVLTLDMAPVALAIGEPSADAPGLIAVVGTDAAAQPSLRVYRADAGVETLALTPVYVGTTAGTIPVAVAAGDLTTDGCADVAVLTRSDAGEGALEVFVGLDATLTQQTPFAPAPPRTVPEMPLGMVLGQWTWDGYLDVAVVSWGQPLTVLDGR